MAAEPHTSGTPSTNQLAYIRDLNDRTGTDFIYPGTAARARAQIERLTALVSRQNIAIAQFTQLGRDAGLPLFDAVHREGTAVRFVWNDRKVMVVVDLADPDPEPSDDGVALAA